MIVSFLSLYLADFGAFTGPVSLDEQSSTTLQIRNRIMLKK